MPLAHEEFDAAHILPDGHPRGEPVVPNGLALCKLHHAAFDGHVLGVRPNLAVELRLDILREPDGPMRRGWTYATFVYILIGPGAPVIASHIIIPELVEGRIDIQRHYFDTSPLFFGILTVAAT